jgi:hypothetical protein
MIVSLGISAERVLQYVHGTYDQEITYCDLGAEVKNKLIGWVDSDFGTTDGNTHTQTDRQTETHTHTHTHTHTWDGGV